MVELVEKFIIYIFKDNSFLATFFISMVPIIELKGALPFGMSAKIFGEKALSPVSAWITASLGSFVPAVFLVWLFVPIMNWLKKTKVFGKISSKFEQKFKKDAIKIDNQSINAKSELKKLFLLMLFVAIPLPLTGAYTGSAIAGYLNLGYFKSLGAILVGNFIAGGIMTLLCTIFKGYETVIFLVFIAVVVVAIMFKIISNAIKKKRNKIETYWLNKKHSKWVLFLS